MKCQHQHGLLRLRILHCPHSHCNWKSFGVSLFIASYSGKIMRKDYTLNCTHIVSAPFTMKPFESLLYWVHWRLPSNVQAWELHSCSLNCPELTEDLSPCTWEVTSTCGETSQLVYIDPWHSDLADLTSDLRINNTQVWLTKLKGGKMRLHHS